MAFLQKKESFEALYLACREFYKGPFDLGNDWTEIRMGMYFTGCSGNTENVHNPDIEQVTVVDSSDYVMVGIKDSSTQFLPGESGSVFVGIRSTSGVSQIKNIALLQTDGVISDINNHMSAVGYDGTTLIDGGQISSGDFSDGAMYFPEIQETQDYCGFYGIKFVISNRGTSSQSIAISLAAQEVVVGFDYSPLALRQSVNNANYGTPITIPWNTGAAARDIPDSFYIRMPFYRNRLMFAATDVIKYQP